MRLWHFGHSAMQSGQNVSSHAGQSSVHPRHTFSSHRLQ